MQAVVLQQLVCLQLDHGRTYGIMGTSVCIIF